MPNQYVNKVVYGNDTLIDITDTTAVASDVASGKYFYNAAGEKVEGTATPGAAVIVDTPDSHGGTVREIITGATAVLQGQKTVTLTPTSTTQTVTPDTGYTGMTSIVVSSPSTLYQYFHNAVNADYVDEDLTSVPAYVCYRNRGGITSCRFPNATSIGTQAFYIAGISGVFFAPKATLAQECLYGNNITISITGGASSAGNHRPLAIYSNKTLTTADLTFKTTYALTGQMFNGQSNLTTVILREAVIYPMYNVNAFSGTPFADGGTGGTIYIPKSLYDCLGDGSSSDYKAATNWSTVDGYGTITWAQIEGSQYDGYYADGTAIPAS